MINKQIVLNYSKIVPMLKETYIDKNIELKITYDFEIGESQIEEGHGIHEVGRQVYVDLTDVKLMVDDVKDGLSVLTLLSKKQIRTIINTIHEQHQNN
jgi:hypothetical protein